VIRSEPLTFTQIFLSFSSASNALKGGCPVCVFNAHSDNAALKRSLNVKAYFVLSERGPRGGSLK
jgi:hypothetical protein